MDHPLDANAILTELTQRYADVVRKEKWGESSLFYNPGGLLPHGVYFCTIKHHDGPNDKASQLDRPGVYRLSIGAGRQAYEQRFGTPPPRPAQGGVVKTGHDFTAFDQITPHPVYGWMSWVAVLNPKRKTLETLRPDLDAAYRLAVGKFEKRRRQLDPTTSHRPA